MQDILQDNPIKHSRWLTMTVMTRKHFVLNQIKGCRRCDFVLPYNLYRTSHWRIPQWRKWAELTRLHRLEV